MRVTMRGGRGSAKHNDHGPSRAGHIDFSLTAQNVSWTCEDKAAGRKLSAEEAEALFYERFFGATVQAQNEKYRAKGNHSRVKTVDEWRQARVNEPREVILQIGDAKESVGGRELNRCVVEFLNWKMKRFRGNLKLISYVQHNDEPGHADHVHVREVWYYHDEQGLPRPGIKAALKEAGIQLPRPSEPEGKDNYRMATVDAECRAKWQEIVRAHGYEIETEPDRERTVGHMGGDAWRAYCNAMEAVNAEKEAVAMDRAELRRREQAEAERERSVSRLIEAGRESLSKKASESVQERPKGRDGLDIPESWL